MGGVSFVSFVSVVGSHSADRHDGRKRSRLLRTRTRKLNPLIPESANFANEHEFPEDSSCEFEVLGFGFRVWQFRVLIGVDLCHSRMPGTMKVAAGVSPAVEGGILPPGSGSFWWGEAPGEPASKEPPGPYGPLLGSTSSFPVKVGGASVPASREILAYTRG
jgi:hypothetical protein